MMDHTCLRAILAQCHFQDWRFQSEERAGELLMHVQFKDGTTTWTGRKWFVSQYSTPSEVVQTALKAVLTALELEHEARESFTYRGRAIFGPHFDVEALMTLVDKNEFSTR